MFHFIKEGQKVHNGFNFYRLTDTASAGFKFRVGDHMWSVRYRKRFPKNRWILGYAKFDRIVWTEFNSRGPTMNPPGAELPK